MCYDFDWEQIERWSNWSGHGDLNLHSSQPAVDPAYKPIPRFFR
jgi:hypothetical protein